MDFPRQIPGVSPPSSSQTNTHGKQHDNNAGQSITTTTTTTNDEATHSWSESISEARSRIHLLSTLLTGDESDTGDPNPISSLAGSDQPARSFLSSATAYSAVSSSLTTSSTEEGPICHWLYDTFLSDDSDLRLVVISFIPLLAGIYFSRIHSLSTPPPSVAGLEAVFMAVYSLETKSRAGKPTLVSIPDLAQPSLYHYPRVCNNIQNPSSAKSNNKSQSQPNQPTITVVSPPLESQTAIKSTKRASIVGVALDCYYKQISQMPVSSKLDFCKFAADWAGQDCPCKFEFDKKPETTMITDRSSTEDIEFEGSVLEQMNDLQISDGNSDNVAKGTRIPLPWELLQPVLRILGHCLLAPLNSNDVKDAASMAVKCLYARSCHDLAPQAILASRSLVQLDKRTRESAAASMANPVSSNDNTPTESEKQETFLLPE